MSFRRRPITAGHDDMVMLSKANDNEITKNLKTRYDSDFIYTYIGEVLIAVNPFKSIPIYSDDFIEKYTGVNMSENPPHIYAIGDDMYKNLMIDKENQCVIISGESGAGKTVNAKFIMEYLSKISGGVGEIERVKSVIIATNPLLEAFGNAKTVRNNNSSRFGKYFTIKFDHGGQPIGGDIRSFLLEKTRVSGQQNGERNFHIFYQLIAGLTNRNENFNFAVHAAENYHYLNTTGTFEADGIDDLAEFQEMEEALGLCGITDKQIGEIYCILSGILHLGNIYFEDAGNDSAFVSDYVQGQGAGLDAVSQTLMVNKDALNDALLTQVVKIGREEISKTLNTTQADNARNSVSQGIYERLFDYLVEQVNRTLKTAASRQTLDVGVLDIYGFEIFDNNGFEQLCINFVNEKLQQIFIELTLKAEQEEYQREGIKWQEIKYKNNLPVCELIEGMRPVGIFAHMDDICKKSSAMDPSSVDDQIRNTLVHQCAGPYLSGSGNKFKIRHYAGEVDYSTTGFFEKNKNTLQRDLIICMQNSQHKFLSDLFLNKNDKLISHPQEQARGKKAPISAGSKIRKQANDLVKALTECRPHYVRCIKPNESKRPKDWEQKRVDHQVKYLGLAENIRVRRAGFAYRRTFDQFLQRYNILQYIDNPARARPPQPYANNPQGSMQGMQTILQHLSRDEWQFGQSKIFIKSPESVNLLEEQRERIYGLFARTIQRHLRNWVNSNKSATVKQEAANVVFQKKDRNRASLKRRFYGDYIGIDKRPDYKQYMDKKEQVIFSCSCSKFNGKMEELGGRFFIMSARRIQIIGWESKVTGFGVVFWKKRLRKKSNFSKKKNFLLISNRK